MNQTITLDGKPESLTEVVYTTILDAIVDRVLEPGARVTESGIAKRLQVSKTPVREAFLRLREVGLLEPHGARGSQVVYPSIATLRHAFEMREALESYTAEMAASRAGEPAIQLIVEAAQQSLDHSQAGNLGHFQAADRSFHHMIAAEAGNPRVAKAIDDAGVLVRTLRQRDVPDENDLVACGRSHLRIAEAIQDRDGPRAAREMREHLQQVQAYVLESWEKAGRAESP